MNEQQRELEYKQHQSKEYEAKLSNLQEHVRVETERGEKLDQTLVECQEEMKVYIEQLNEMKQQHEYDINNKITEVVLVLSPFSTKRICSREHKIQLRDWLAKTFAFSSTNQVAEFCVRANKFA